MASIAKQKKKERKSLKIPTEINSENIPSMHFFIEV